MSSNPVKHQFNITQLADLTLIKDDIFNGIFCNNIQKIYEYGEIDIKAVLDERKEDTIKDIRLQLIKKLKECEAFEAYKNKTPINRTSKSKIYQDIIAIGKSISKNEQDPNLEKAFTKTETPEQTLDLSDPAKMAAVVLQMMATINVLEGKLEAVTSERDALDTRITYLESKMGKYDEDNSEVSEHDNDTNEPNSGTEADSEDSDGFVEVISKKKRKKQSKEIKGKPEQKSKDAAPQPKYQGKTQNYRPNYNNYKNKMHHRRPYNQYNRRQPFRGQRRFTHPDNRSYMGYRNAQWDRRPEPRYNRYGYADLERSYNRYQTPLWNNEYGQRWSDDYYQDYYTRTTY